VTVAVVLVALAAFAVVGAVVSGSWLVASLAALLALALGAAATKITHSELMATRVEAARDRAQQAQGYRAITEARVAEQARHDAYLNAEISRREETVADLEAALTAAHQRAADAVRARADEARRADRAERDGQALAVRLEEAEQRAAEAIVRVHELEAELDAVRGELVAAQSAWAKARTA
jgi:chromosome segregation ATPase